MNANPRLGDSLSEDPSPLREVRACPKSGCRVIALDPAIRLVFRGIPLAFRTAIEKYHDAMSVEVRPFAAQCNLRCSYCYQDAERRSGSPQAYDLSAVRRRLDGFGQPFTLFGGEPLLMPLKDLAALFEYGYERFGENYLQTNGTLITDEHLRLFRQFRVRVSVSIDGPGELNGPRRALSVAATRRTTEQVEAAIDALCATGIIPSLIVTLHRHNARADRLPVMNDWFVALDRKGIRSARLHILESQDDHSDAELALTQEENIAAFTNFYRLESQLGGLSFDVFHDMRLLLVGEDQKTSCVWKACDPYTTRAVQGIEGDGELTNCGRTYKEGIAFLKGEHVGFQRYVSL